MIKQLKNAKSTTFLHDEDIFVVSQTILGKLKKAAKNDPLGRSRLCVHKSHNDTVQEMIVALRKGFYVRPHKHIGKTESFHIIEGSIVVVFFDDTGKITRKIQMAHLGDNKPYIYRLSSETWHTALPLSNYIIFHEILCGPFDRTSSVFPDWAPKENDIAGINKYLKKLTTLVGITT